MDTCCVVEYIENGAIAVLKNIKNDSWINLQFQREFLHYLDEIESNPSVKVLITTGCSKYYSNGLDLKVLATMTSEEAVELIKNMQLLDQRLLVFPRPTIAVVNGHAYGGGAILALVHDYIIMREERGWFCLPEVKLEKRFGFFLGVLKAKIPQSEQLNCIVMGKRYTAKEALEAKFIHYTSPGDQLMQKAVDIGRGLIKQDYNPEALQRLKLDLYHKEYESLKEMTPKYYKSKL